MDSYFRFPYYFKAKDCRHLTGFLANRAHFVLCVAQFWRAGSVVTGDFSCQNTSEAVLKLQRLTVYLAN